MFAAIQWNIDPELFSLGPLSIRWYGLLFALGFILSYQVLKKMFLKDDLKELHVDKITIYIVIGTIAGARLGHCFFYDWAYFQDHILEIFLPFRFEPEFEFTGFQGLASHGGAIGILTAIYFYCRKYKLGYLWVLDRVVIVVALTGGLIRLGNLMNSEILGVETTVAWGFQFMREYCPAPYDCSWDTIPIQHPAQLYESISSFLIFAGLLFLYNKTDIKKAEGRLFSIFLVVLFTLRFFYEFLKESQKAFEDDMVLNMGQLLSIPLVLIGIVLFFVVKKKATS